VKNALRRDSTGGSLACSCVLSHRQSELTADVGGHSVALIFIIVPLYIDWALGILVWNVIGLQSRKNKALYWLFFAASTLPMPSIKRY
jgi:hypothetical protein